MEQHAGIDVSLEWSSVCIVDASCKIVKEIKVASEPEVLVEFFKGLSMDLEASMRGILRGFGLKMGVVTRKGFEARVRELSAGQAMLERVTSAMLEARAALWREFEQLHREMLRIVRDDEICQRLMSILGVGPLVAITFKSAIDDPGRIAKSKTIGALFGLVPKKYQSGERDVSVALARKLGVVLHRIRCLSGCTPA